MTHTVIIYYSVSHKNIHANQTKALA